MRGRGRGGRATRRPCAADLRSSPRRQRVHSATPNYPTATTTTSQATRRASSSFVKHAAFSPGASSSLCVAMVARPRRTMTTSLLGISVSGLISQRDEQSFNVIVTQSPFFMCGRSTVARFPEWLGQWRAHDPAPTPPCSPSAHVPQAAHPRATEHFTVAHRAVDGACSRRASLRTSPDFSRW